MSHIVRIDFDKERLVCVVMVLKVSCTAKISYSSVIGASSAQSTFAKKNWKIV